MRLIWTVPVCPSQVLRINIATPLPNLNLVISAYRRIERDDLESVIVTIGTCNNSGTVGMNDPQIQIGGRSKRVAGIRSGRIPDNGYSRLPARDEPFGSQSIICGFCGTVIGNLPEATTPTPHNVVDCFNVDGACAVALAKT